MFSLNLRTFEKDCFKDCCLKSKCLLWYLKWMHEVQRNSYKQYHPILKNLKF